MSPIYLLTSVVFFSLFTVSELRSIIIMDRNRVTEQDGELGARGAAKNHILMHWPVVASRTVTRLCETKQTLRGEKAWFMRRYDSLLNPTAHTGFVGA